jgi:hypothetical protein
VFLNIFMQMQIFAAKKKCFAPGPKASYGPGLSSTFYLSVMVVIISMKDMQDSTAGTE